MFLKRGLCKLHWKSSPSCSYGLIYLRSVAVWDPRPNFPSRRIKTIYVIIGLNEVSSNIVFDHERILFLAKEIHFLFEGTLVEFHQGRLTVAEGRRSSLTRNQELKMKTKPRGESAARLNAWAWNFPKEFYALL